MKQTAVEWLQQALEDTILDHEQIMQTIGLFEQAKAMHKEEIMEAHGEEQSKLQNDGSWKRQTAKQYYNETFNTKEK